MTLVDASKRGEKLVDREVDGTYSLASLVFNGNFCRAAAGIMFL